ncbi:MAG: hypothetical protein AABX61_00515 [Nanoarchaeota archaeon]
MDLKYHLLSCIILTLILYPFFNYYSLLVFIFGFFIDSDHYLYDIIKTRNLSIINSYKVHMNEERVAKDQLHIFHTIEFIISFLLLTLISRNIYLILLSIGLLVHLILDMINMIYSTINNIEFKQTRALSLILWINRNL